MFVFDIPAGGMSFYFLKMERNGDQTVAAGSNQRLTVDQAQNVLDSAPFGKWWGFVVNAIGDGEATVTLPHRPEHFRPGNVLQGGCCMTLADVAFWLAIMSQSGVDDTSVTLEMKTNFLRGASSDLTSTGRIINGGRRIVYGEATTTDLDGRLIAHHTLTYLRPN